MFAWLVVSCKLESDSSVEIAPDQLEIVSASIEHRALFEEWIGDSSNPNARTKRGQYNSGDLVEIRIDGAI